VFFKDVGEMLISLVTFL